MKWKKREAETARLREKHRGRKYHVPMPDLSVEQRASPTSDRFAPTLGKRELPRGAKQFAVAAPHKQGYQLLTDGAIRDEMHLFARKP